MIKNLSILKPFLKKCLGQHLQLKAAGGIEICERHPALVKYGIQPKIAFTYDSYQAAIELLVSTDNWSLLPGDIIERTKGGVVAIAHPRSWSAPYQVVLVWSRKNVSRELVEALCTSKI